MENNIYYILLVKGRLICMRTNHDIYDWSIELERMDKEVTFTTNRRF